MSPLAQWVHHNFGGRCAQKKVFNDFSTWGDLNLGPIVSNIMGLSENHSRLDPELSIRAAAVFLYEVSVFVLEKIFELIKILSVKFPLTRINGVRK